MTRLSTMLTGVTGPQRKRKARGGRKVPRKQLFSKEFRKLMQRVQRMVKLAPALQLNIKEKVKAKLK